MFAKRNIGISIILLVLVCVWYLNKEMHNLHCLLLNKSCLFVCLFSCAFHTWSYLNSLREVNKLCTSAELPVVIQPSSSNSALDYLGMICQLVCCDSISWCVVKLISCAFRVDWNFTRISFRGSYPMQSQKVNVFVS